MPIYSLEGITPVVHPDAFVHESADLVGDVIIGAGCYVGPGASLRGDFGRIIVEQGANVQDVCVLHTFPGKECRVERDGHIGHGAVLHGCRIGVNAMVGMKAVVMDDADIGECSIIGAQAMVPSGFVCPPNSLVIGIPARVKRTLSDEEIKWKSQGTLEYQQLTQRCQASLLRTEALTEVESDRERMDSGHYQFKPNNGKKDH